MSVHGEYGRALEGLIACLRALDVPDRAAWIARFESVRVADHPDLSAAARGGIDALEALARAHGPQAGDDASKAAWGPRVEAAHENLLAHCRIILGHTA